jgi:hypothetical protein
MDRTPALGSVSLLNREGQKANYLEMGSELDGVWNRCHDNSSSSALASCRSAVSKPSVNQL